MLLKQVVKNKYIKLFIMVVAGKWWFFLFLLVFYVPIFLEEPCKFIMKKSELHFDKQDTDEILSYQKLKITPFFYIFQNYKRDLSNLVF